MISRGMLSFSRPGEEHSIQPGDFRRPISYYAVLFSLTGSDPLSVHLDSPGFRKTFPRSIGSRRRLLFEDLKTGFSHTSPARVHAAHHTLQAFLWELAAQTESDRGGSDAAPDHNVHISRAIRIFEQNLNTTVTMAEVARALSITQAHLTRLFTYHFGVSPLQYYRRLRMDVAASMLLDTTRSIKEIAWELGYSNQFHFSRSFRRYADMSPSRYRQQYYRNNPTQYATRLVHVGEAP